MKKGLLTCLQCKAVITNENHVKTTLPDGEQQIHPCCMHCWDTWKGKPAHLTDSSRLAALEEAVQTLDVSVNNIAKFIRNSIRGEGEKN